MIDDDDDAMRCQGSNFMVRRCDIPERDLPHCMIAGLLVHSAPISNPFTWVSAFYPCGLGPLW